MTIRSWVVSACGCLLLAANETVAQTTTAPAGGGQAPSAVVRSGQLGGVVAVSGVTFGGGGGSFGFVSSGVTGKPYTAEQETVQEQTLADGTHIRRDAGSVKMYRDSEGRTRTERTFSPPAGGVMASVPAFVEIIDPVEGARYTLDQRNHVAHKAAWHKLGGPTTASGAVSPAPPPPPPSPVAPHVMNRLGNVSGGNGIHPEIKREPLGTQMIEGVPADGTRITMTFPAGMMWNDRPFSTTSETWFSKDLQLPVLMKNSDPRYGETTTTTTNISLTEPDPSLFQVPADYKTDGQ